MQNVGSALARDPEANIARKRASYAVTCRRANFVIARGEVASPCFAPRTPLIGIDSDTIPKNEGLTAALRGEAFRKRKRL
jgi:hypothetical protein